jgi:Flp pilus assembly protein TadB
MCKLGMVAAAALLASAGVAYAQDASNSQAEAEAARDHEARDEATNDTEANAEEQQQGATARRRTLPPQVRPTREYTRGPRRPR